MAIDGKTPRGSRGAQGAVHLVSAFASRARWVLAQEAVAEKSNETAAIPALLDLLDVSGAVVTIDAMGCQKDIARQIPEKEADTVLALKDNHPTLNEEVRLWLDTEMAQGRLAVREVKGNVRVERRYFLCSLTEPDRFAETVRAHGCIENAQHGVLLDSFIKLLTLK